MEHWFCAGHSHQHYYIFSFLILDIDALFGCIGNKLLLCEAVTLPQLMEIIKQSIKELDCQTDNRATKGVEPYYLAETYDYRSWIEPHVKTFYNISRPHIFRCVQNLSECYS